MKWVNEFELAVKAVASGLTVLDERNGDFSVQTKESFRDIVTSIDIDIEKQIRYSLSGSPYKIIGEESFDIKGNFPDLKKETAWMIDPIDGTTNMVSGVPLYSISLGLIDKLSFPIGVVVIPVQKELFFTFGDNAYLNNRKLQIKSTKFEESLNACAFSSKALNNNTRAIEYELFGLLNDSTRGCLRTGSASVNICYVAAGRFQCAYGIQNRIWDVAGPLAIAQNAGAAIYFELMPNSSYINYVVGVASVAQKVAELLKNKSLANVSLIG